MILFILQQRFVQLHNSLSSIAFVILLTFKEFLIRLFKFPPFLFGHANSLHDLIRNAKVLGNSLTVDDKAFHFDVSFRCLLFRHSNDIFKALELLRVLFELFVEIVEHVLFDLSKAGVRSGHQDALD